ncbi:MAG: SRPBCC family protein [Chitinophagales bacterium]
MAFYQFQRVQNIPASKAEVWDFISSPANLKEITPPSMGFIITSANLPAKMYAGMIISYKVTPLLGIPLTWVTEITQVVDGAYFIDEQRIGPYALWHHQHKLVEIPGGICMTDIISYEPPFGPLGAIANTLFISNKLKEIFDYRFEAVVKRFGAFLEKQ